VQVSKSVLNVKASFKETELELSVQIIKN